MWGQNLAQRFYQIALFYFYLIHGLFMKHIHVYKCMNIFTLRFATTNSYIMTLSYLYKPEIIIIISQLCSALFLEMKRCSQIPREQSCGLHCLPAWLPIMLTLRGCMDDHFTQDALGRTDIRTGWGQQEWTCIVLLNK